MVRILVLLLTAFALVGVSRESAAQHFSFGFGHHADWHHDYDHWHDHHWVPPPRVVYVYPSPPAQPTYAPPVAVRQLDARATLSDRVPAKTASVPPKNAIPAGRVTIKNACSHEVAVAFLVDGKEAQLDDGATQSFSGARVVDFDRGGDFGSAQMELTPGDYEFVIGDKGWQLVRNETKSDSSQLPVAKKNTLPATAR